MDIVVVVAQLFISGVWIVMCGTLSHSLVGHFPLTSLVA